MSDTLHSLHDAALQILLAPCPQQKIDRGIEVAKAWHAGKLGLENQATVVPLQTPGRPAQPELLSPQDMPRRRMNTVKGRTVLIHAVAHIEFNAINLAWDAVYRFRDMPKSYYDDWISVALDESRHFDMLNGYLMGQGSFYGEFPAHNGLWDMAIKTDYDVMVRMALVPRVLEARGLDVTPAMLERLRAAGDLEAVKLLEIILEEEINHVRIGTRWYHYCCEQRGVDKLQTFMDLIESVQSKPKGPFNVEARLLAGFEQDELDYLEELQ